MNTTLKSALAVLAVSVVALVWGGEYRSDHPLAAVGAIFGSADQTYVLAGWALGLGVLAFLIGLALLIAGLVRGHRGSTPASN